MDREKLFNSNYLMYPVYLFSHIHTRTHTHTAFMYYYDNPKGMIPTWLINWAAKASTMTATD